MDMPDQSPDAAAIMRVIEAESQAFWNKDYHAWTQCWVHAPYIRMHGWWQRDRGLGSH